MAAALALASCGSDDGDSGGGGSSSSTSAATGSAASSTQATAAAPTGDPIKIAYPASMSGPQATNGLGAQGVAHAWQEATNASGGILGHPVEVTVTDTKNTVPGASAALKSAMADPDVDAIFLTDLVAEASLQDLVTGTDVAIISGNGATDVPWTTTPGLFQDVSGADYATQAYVETAKAQGTTKLAWASCAEVAICQSNSEKGVDYATSLGIDSGGTQLISASASDYIAECLSYTSDGADGIAMYIGYSTGVRLASDCLQQGYTGKFFTANSGFDQKAFGELSGFTSAGSTEGFPWWADDPAVAAYRDAMQKYSPKVTYQSGNQTAIWSSFELLKKALEDAKPATIDRSTVMAAMYQVKDETLGGLLSTPITYTQGQPSKPVDCSWIFTFDAGDDEPASVAPDTAGNGASGDLASTCAKPFDE